MFDALADFFGFEEEKPKEKPREKLGLTIPPAFFEEDEPGRVQKIDASEGKALNKLLCDYANTKEELEQLFELMVKDRSKPWVKGLEDRVNLLPQRHHDAWKAHLRRYDFPAEFKTTRISRFHSGSHPFLSLFSDYCYLRMLSLEKGAGLTFILQQLTTADKVSEKSTQYSAEAIGAIVSCVAQAYLADKAVHRGAPDEALLALWRRAKLCSQSHGDKLYAQVKKELNVTKKRFDNSYSAYESFALFSLVDTLNDLPSILNCSSLNPAA